jgi:hypothetical protein
LNLNVATLRSRPRIVNKTLPRDGLPQALKKYMNFIKVFEPECRYAPVMAANRYQNLTEGRVTPSPKKVVVTKTLPRDGLPQALKSSCYQNLTEGRATHHIPIVAWGVA